MTHCKPTKAQLGEENKTEATDNCREQKAKHCSDKKESSKSSVTPKKTTVLIMVAPPTDLQQVG